MTRHVQRREMRVEITAVIPLGQADSTEMTERLTHELMWQFDAENVSVTEVSDA